MQPGKRRIALGQEFPKWFGECAIRPFEDQPVCRFPVPRVLGFQSTHELIGRRSYKSDTRAQQTPERLIARKDIVDALEQGRTSLDLRLRLTHAQRDALAADASGDRLDAVLCLMQAAWSSIRPGYGLPPSVDPLEGWIVSAAPLQGR